MLWVAVCLLLLQTVAAQNQVCQIYTEAKEDGFKSLIVICLAQNLPDITQDEMVTFIDEALALGSNCCSDAPVGDCERDPVDLFQSVVCSYESIVERNNLKSCCEQSGAERSVCFVDHKVNISRDYSLQTWLPTEDECPDFKKDDKAFLGKLIFSFSKRNVLLPPQVILGIAKGYSDVMVSCCGDADPQTCFDNKEPPFQAAVRNRVTQHRAHCFAHSRYGERVVKAKKLVRFSQKVPQAPVEVMQSTVDKLFSTTAPCCQGDMGTCMRLRKQLIDELCANENLISTSAGLATCCKADVFSRGSCIGSMTPDPKPEGLSEEYDLHANIQAVCDSFTKTPQQAMVNLIYEVSRRHPEASEAAILRYAQATERAFLMCCAKEGHAECVKAEMTDRDLEKDITDGLAHYRNISALKRTVGDGNYEKILLVLYTRAMPQATFDQLHHVSKTVTSVLSECLKNDHRVMACEDMLTDIIDVVCQEVAAASINPQISNCCNQSYSTRKICIMTLRPDVDFQPPELDTKNFPMGADLCTKEAADLFLSEKMLLYVLVRQKPTISHGQLHSIRQHFQAMKSKCCAEADQEACFSTEASELITGVAELLKTNDSCLSCLLKSKNATDPA
ncbi:vitamin D-binding protein isoform 2-T2 [Polymixia lowei]